MKPASLQGHSLLASAALGAGLALSGAAAGEEFQYSGNTGPGAWSSLSPDWQACAGDRADARQSPVDIVDAKPDDSLKKLSLTTQPTTIALVNNGHTIEQHYEDTDSRIEFEGRRYELLQFHFHTLSEHAIGGNRSEMEMHAVFAAETGDKLVIGTLYDAGSHSSPFLQALIDVGLPGKGSEHSRAATSIDLADGLTDTSSYYSYAGSLTTPPCAENVTWVVLKKPATMTQAQAGAFQEILGNDFRPLQSLNGRVVRASRD